MAGSRQYDIILLGATGYTGKYTAEHITSSLPTSLKWAIAGRSESKLKSLIDDLKELNTNRNAPDVIPIQLSAPELTSLAKQTRVLINTVGPYHLYSTPIVQACAESGTHYVDATGETPWVKEIIQKFEATAKKTGAILIPEAGVESTPSDLIAYAATDLVRRVWDCGVLDMIGSVHELKSSGASGGTLATGIGLLDYYPMKTLKQCLNDPFVLSPTHLAPFTKESIYPRSPDAATYSRTALQKFTGVWNYPRLGNLTTSLSAKPNQAIVHRSAGLTPLFYGFNFSYEEYMAVSNPLIGFVIHAVIAILTLLLTVSPIRALFKAIVPFQPGSGPTKEASTNDVVELRGIAIAEQLTKSPRKAQAIFRYEGSMYKLTGLFLAEAAMVLLEKADDVVKMHGTGFLTPSCLGEPFIDRVKKAGVTLSVQQIGEIGSK